MVNVNDVDALDLINAVKEELKKNEQIKPPEWAQFAKSGAHCERPPEQPDFWYIRAASMLRKIYVRGPVGVSRLRTEYGGARNRGVKPEEHRKASGSIIRALMKQLELAGYVKNSKKGRSITPQGQKLLDNVAYVVYKTPKVKKEAVYKEAPRKEKIALPGHEKFKQEQRAKSHQPKAEGKKEESKPAAAKSEKK
ncbi:MAG: 30S ribosomal protein S19e [archaeon]